jgi:hypothetical protein
MTTLLGWCCLFLLGYLLAGQRSSWEQTMLQEGTVAHYGIWNLLKPGWEAELQDAKSDLDSITGELKTLSDEHVSLTDGDKKELRGKWMSIRKKVDASQKTLSYVQAKYGLSDEQKQMVATVMTQKVAEMSGVVDSALPPGNPLAPSPLRPDDSKRSSQSTSKPAPTKSGTSGKPAPASRSKPAGPEQPGPTKPK